eukprot:jgi/Astpho2/5104/gw1.00073.74.1_t
MEHWGFDYVESLTWVFLHPNNSIAHLPSALCRSSHLTLFIFRRSGEAPAEGKGRDIELRHQRNPDVVFDCLGPLTGGLQAAVVRDEVFNTIEMLLPSGKGSFLELWAPGEGQRPGWTHVCCPP